MQCPPSAGQWASDLPLWALTAEALRLARVAGWHPVPAEASPCPWASRLPRELRSLCSSISQAGGRLEEAERRAGDARARCCQPACLQPSRARTRCPCLHHQSPRQPQADLSLCTSWIFCFYRLKVMASLHRASLSAPFFQQHLLTWRLCHTSVTCNI